MIAILKISRKYIAQIDHDLNQWSKFNWFPSSFLRSFLPFFLLFFNILLSISESLNYATAVSQVCDDHLMTQFLSGQPYTNTSIYDHLRQVSDSKFLLTSFFTFTRFHSQIAPTFSETAFLCQFQDEVAECDQFFSEVWTDEGLCFTFNLLNLTDITSEL